MILIQAIPPVPPPPVPSIPVDPNLLLTRLSPPGIVMNRKWYSSPGVA